MMIIRPIWLEIHIRRWLMLSQLDRFIEVSFTSYSYFDHLLLVYYLLLYLEHHRLVRDENGDIIVEQLRVDLRVFPHIPVIHFMYRIRRAGARPVVRRGPE